MTVIFSPSDLERFKKNPKLDDFEKHVKLDVSVDSTFVKTCSVIELEEEDVVLYNYGTETTILKGPNELL